MRERRTPAPRKATAVFEAIDVPDSIPEVFLLKMRSLLTLYNTFWWLCYGKVEQY